MRLPAPALDVVRFIMKPNYALALSFDGIRLLRRTKDGWRPLGEVALDSPRFSEEMAAMVEKARAHAPHGVRCKVVIPEEQIRYLTLPTSQPGRDRINARAALEGQTPYPVEELSFDCAGAADGTLRIAAVAHETLDEAESFALDHGLEPMSFVAIPSDESLFEGEPYLGTALHARKTLKKGDNVRRDSVVMHILPPEEEEAAPAPAATTRDTGEKDDVLAKASAVMANPVAATEAIPDAPFIDIEEADEFTDAPTASLTARRDAPVPPAQPSGQTLKAEREAKGGIFGVIGGLLSGLRPQAANGRKSGLGLLIVSVAGVFVTGIAASMLLLGGAEDDTAALDPDVVNVTVTPDVTGDNDESAGDLADLDHEPLAPTTPAPSPEEANTTLAIYGAPEDLLPVPPAATPEPEVAEAPAEAPPAPTIVPMTEAEALALYSRSGIYPLAPEPPLALGEVGNEDLYVPSMDNAVPSLDAVALPLATSYSHDIVPDRQGLPPAAEHVFALDDNGLVKATPEGTLAPDGYRVFAGRPSVVPPERPALETPEPEPEAVAEAVANDWKIRPQSRPQDLIQEVQRANLGGRTLDELAQFRPRARPDDLVPAPLLPDQGETAEAVMASLREATAGGSTVDLEMLQGNQNVDHEAEADAIPDELATASLMPKARPSNFEKTVRKATPEPEAPAPQKRTASAAPSIPSKASVQKAATEDNVLNLKKTNLIGVYGASSDRRALVRLSNGRYKKVKVGDSLDGGRVAAIGSDDLKLVKGGRNIVLTIPQS
ncbi:hypothetical protein CLV74_104198 [Donghicola tyrosinivorans]|uniref:Type IV pilus biogenesis protein PilP n=2 Tax=Donghicola tyrosinivorans TaxID=1652492 RepID=A0A2T0WWV8_9RHOB|nr:hypothetical protein CLV74_104198 [Donghicola tyrosinivorans]